MSIEKAHPFPGNVLMHVDQFNEADDSCAPDLTGEVRTVTTDLESAVVITSTMTSEALPLGVFDDVEPMHRPVLDIDVPVTLLDSSTPGHHHLLIDKPMTWAQYRALLVALVKAGVVERGYVDASVAREHSCVRVPWLRKGDPMPPLPEQRAAARAADIEQAARRLLQLQGEPARLAAKRLRELLGLSDDSLLVDLRDVARQRAEVW